MQRLVRYPGDFIKQLRYDLALDLTRLGERLLDAPKLTKRDIMYQTADLRDFEVSPKAVVDPSVVITGNTYVQDCVVLAKNVVLRGDTHGLDIMQETTVGEATVIVSTSRKANNPLSTHTWIGPKCHIGAKCVLSSVKISQGVTIGDGSVVGECSIIRQGAILDPNTVVPAGSIVPEFTHWGGNPAKYLGPAVAGH
ncbi:hypothetical protein BASA81_000249 [Batrachochytrium salamandrivorans]|nr:hypothetical protein BASA81_000249 [Batrachochytrium salamandrivorans]